MQSAARHRGEPYQSNQRPLAYLWRCLGPTYLRNRVALPHTGLPAMDLGLELYPRFTTCWPDVGRLKGGRGVWGGVWALETGGASLRWTDTVF